MILLVDEVILKGTVPSFFISYINRYSATVFVILLVDEVILKGTVPRVSSCLILIAIPPLFL